MLIEGKNIGDIHINVYETQNGNNFFYIEATNKEVLPILDYVQTILEKY